jgi:hypothetical protein
MARPKEGYAMNLVSLECDALEILTTLENMNSAGAAAAIAAARALADALADAAEARSIDHN